MEPEKEILKRDLLWWSEELHKAHLLVKYWKAKQFYTIQGEPFHDNLISRENELIDIDIHQSDYTRPIASQIRKAKKSHRLIRARSYKKQQDFLEKLANDAATEGNNRARIIRIIRETEQNRSMYRTFKRYLKPEDRTGLIQFDVPEWEKVEVVILSIFLIATNYRMWAAMLYMTIMMKETKWKTYFFQLYLIKESSLRGKWITIYSITT